MINYNESIYEIDLKTVSTLDDFSQLTTIWNEMAFNESTYNFFLSHEWFSLWLKHFLEPHQLFILLIYGNNTPLAIAPLFLKTEQFKGVIIKKIELIGNAYAPVRNFLFSNLSESVKGSSLKSLLSFLGNRYRSWDLIDFSPLKEEDRNLHLLHSTLNELNFKYQESFCFGNWYMDDITSSADQYFKTFDSKFRHNINYRRRRLEKRGLFTYKIVTHNDIDKYMDYYYEVYSKSWQQKEGIGPTFHRDLAKLASKRGWLRLGFLFLDNRPISSQFWIVSSGTAHILKTVYDQKYKNDAPGMILTWEMIKHTIDVDKVREIDYGEGDEAYKRKWLPKRRERKRILIFNNNLKGKFLSLLLRKILPKARQSSILTALKKKLNRTYLFF